MENIDIFNFEGKFGTGNEPIESGYFETQSEEEQKISLEKSINSHNSEGQQTFRKRK